jgi:hypothetical protein
MNPTDREAHDATTYILGQIADAPVEALRAIIEQRVRQAMAEALAIGASRLQGLASEITMRRRG